MPNPAPAWLPIVAVIPLCLSIGITRWSRTRVQSESKATPPSWVFQVAWTAFYLVLGALLFMQLQPLASGQFVKPWQYTALAMLGVHLVLTFAWMPLYTSGRRRAALYNLVAVLATALALQMLLLSSHTPLFAVLLAPYIAWLLFALLLNYEAVTRKTH